MQIALLLQDNAIFHHLQPLRELFVFYVLNCILQRHHSIFYIILYYTKHKEQLLDYFTQILSNQLLRMGSYSFLIVFVFKRINFRTACEFFPILLSCKLNFAVYWKHLSSHFLHVLFYLFCLFIQLEESIYCPPQCKLILCHK